MEGDIVLDLSGVADTVYMEFLWLKNGEQIVPEKKKLEGYCNPCIPISDIKCLECEAERRNIKVGLTHIEKMKNKNADESNCKI